MLEFGQVLAPLVKDIARPNWQHALFVVCNAVFILTQRGVVPRPPTLTDDELRREILKLVLPYLLASKA